MLLSEVAVVKWMLNKILKVTNLHRKCLLHLKMYRLGQKHSLQFKYNKICASHAVLWNVVLLAVLLHENVLTKLSDKYQTSNKNASFNKVPLAKVHGTHEVKYKVTILVLPVHSCILPCIQCWINTTCSPLDKGTNNWHQISWVVVALFHRSV